MKKNWTLFFISIYLFGRTFLFAQTISPILDYGESLRKTMPIEIRHEQINTIADTIGQVDLAENYLKKNPKNSHVWLNLDIFYNKLHIFFIETVRKRIQNSISDEEWESFEKIIDHIFYFKPPAPEKNLHRSILDGCWDIVDKYACTINPKETRPLQYHLAIMYLQYFQCIFEEEVSNWEINKINKNFKKLLRKTIYLKRELADDALGEEIVYEDIENFFRISKIFALTFKKSFWTLDRIKFVKNFAIGTFVFVAIFVGGWKLSNWGERTKEEILAKFDEIKDDIQKSVQEIKNELSEKINNFCKPFSIVSKVITWPLRLFSNNGQQKNEELDEVQQKNENKQPNGTDKVERQFLVDMHDPKNFCIPF